MTRFRSARDAREQHAQAHVREVSEIRRSATTGGLRGPDVNGNWFVCCPFCEHRVRRRDEEFKLTIRISGELAASEKRPDPLELRPDFGVWNCYRCHARGFADFRWMVDDRPAPVAGEFTAAEPVNLGPPEGFVLLSECLRSISMSRFANYFSGRGVLDQAIAVGAGACASGRYQGRVVVPYVERAGGPWLGFSARLVDARADDRRPKYLYPRGMDRRAALWGTAWLGVGASFMAPKSPPSYTGRPDVFIVEGVFDALPLFPCALATFGKSVTDAQLDRLVALDRPLVACLDGDAWEECRALAARLEMRGARARWAHLPPGADPGSLGWKVLDYIGGA